MEPGDDQELNMPYNKSSLRNLHTETKELMKLKISKKYGSPV